MSERPIRFKYYQVGHIIMFDESEWNRVLKWLKRSETIMVDIGTSNKVLQIDSGKATAKPKPIKVVSSRRS